LERRLAAILAADVVGYSRLMGEDEQGTLSRLKSLRTELVQPKITERKGRIVKLMGDGLLAEFPSVVEAVQCASDIQLAMADREPEISDDRRIRLRIGINLGDIIVEGSDIYGDGVNVAARLEGLADPGGVCISGPAFDAVDGKLELAFEEAGEQQVKNIAKPVRIYRLASGSPRAGPTLRPTEPLPLPDKPSIVVLPFDNMSGDPEQEYFSDGMTEDIITELSRFHGLSVIARNSAFHYKGKSPKIHELAHELGVGYVVEGSVRKAGNRVRITVQLIDAVTGNHVWAERYDRDIEDIFAVQDEVTRIVVSTVAGRIDSVGYQRATRMSPESLKAYDLFLRAKSLCLRFTRADNSEARDLLKRAVSLDPANAQARAVLCTTYFMDWFGNWVEDGDRALKEAIRWGKEAVATDDADCRSHWTLGEAYLAARQFDKARFHFEKATSLNPHDVEARTGYGFFLTCVRETPKAIEEFNLARQVDPQDLSYLPWLEGFAHFTARQYHEAIACFERIDEPHFEVYSLLAACYAQLGQLDKAKPLLQEFLRRAEEEMVDFPGRSSAAWRRNWHTLASYQDEADSEHWLDGLRKAGLER